eukprot:TRINITY_DN1387_c0_g1_i2.p1 TRINITY_DN1387_c0_g1~~TRINITY_DN1387_c0_g1_i2.p1  ORF type:complete len:309 (+),score=57.51 TRINITY_DN1387_c0_g1_i2:61-987(+)
MQSEEKYEVRNATPEEVKTIHHAWAAGQGWNPGNGDIELEMKIDSNAFFVGVLNGEVIGCISVYNWNDQYSFLGTYIVKSEYRGQGYGLKLWNQAIEHAGDRTTVLEAVVHRTSTYARSGFHVTHPSHLYQQSLHNLLSTLRTQEKAASNVVPIPADIQLVPAFNRLFHGGFGVEAPQGVWQSMCDAASGRVGYCMMQGEECTGLIFARPAAQGWRLGPWLAQSQEIAQALISTIISHLGDMLTQQQQSLDTPIEFLLTGPEPHQASQIAQDLGFNVHPYCARMQTNDRHRVQHVEWVFGQFSWEFGP